MTGNEPTYDESMWPFVLVVLPEVELSNAAFEAHLDKLTSYYHRGVSFALVIDMRTSPPLPAHQRRLLGPVPIHAVSTVAEGLEWARQSLKRAG